MMRIGLFAAANEAGWFGNIAKVLAIPITSRCRDDEHALVDAVGQIAVAVFCRPRPIKEYSEQRRLQLPRSPRISLLLLICPASGSSLCMVAARREARHGFEREPDPWRAGDECLERMSRPAERANIEHSRLRVTVSEALARSHAAWSHGNFSGPAGISGGGGLLLHRATFAAEEIFGRTT
jgi:hypothetical protein